MKSIRYWTVIVMAAAGLWLVACGSNESPTHRECSEQKLCIDLEIAGPVQADHPLTATITVESWEDFADLHVRLWASDPEVQFGEPREWWITTTAGATTQMSATLQFPPQAGAYRVHAGVLLPSGQVVQDTVPVGIAAGGATAPRIQRSPQVPLLIEPVTPTLSPEAQQLSESALSAGDRSMPEPYPESVQPNTTVGWIQIGGETFDGVFPAATAPWSVQDLIEDGAERYWDDDDYRAHAGNWAVWPANGGADGVIPEPGADAYANNMNTRMVYGPFDLSDAVAALTQFYLWREMEAPHDYLAFEISHDGVAFEELSRWSGEQPTWELQQVEYENYLGDDSVWVAWRFYSDADDVRQGPWIDTVGIWKLVPGEVIAQGSLHFYDRINTYGPAVATQVYLYDDDGAAGFDNSDDRLDATRTDAQGVFTFTPQVNWDADAAPSGERALDLYVVWETDDPISGQRTTDFADWSYQFRSETITDTPAGSLAFAYYIPNNARWEPAMWIFQDMIRGWTYVHSAAGENAGEAVVRWEDGATALSPCDGSCFCPGAAVKGIFIDDQGAGSPDIVVHELGHHFMYNAVGAWWQADPESMSACTNHGLRDSINPMCAWTEGWASFFALAVNGDACFDWESPPCQGLTVNLELPTWGSQQWNDGDEVEGRVAGALYDLLDSREDGQDRAAVGFGPIWAIADETEAENGLASFWDRWKAGPEDAHLPVQALYQNTINYNTPPLLLLPDRKVLEGRANPRAIDLSAYTADSESDAGELAWEIVTVSDWHCDLVGIDSQKYVNLNIPYRGWYNACDITVRATDGLQSTEDTFAVQVAPIKTRVNLPFITRSH